MSDVRARLVEALGTELEIRRGAVPNWAAHIADVLLSLPGIAIVELPEPLHFLHNWTHFGPMAIYDKRPGEVNFGVRDWISPQRARELAGALLAAAVAAEQAPQ